MFIEDEYGVHLYTFIKQNINFTRSTSIKENLNWKGLSSIFCTKIASEIRSRPDHGPQNPTNPACLKKPDLTHDCMGWAWAEIFDRTWYKKNPTWPNSTRKLYIKIKFYPTWTEPDPTQPDHMPGWASGLKIQPENFFSPDPTWRMIRSGLNKHLSFFLVEDTWACSILLSISMLFPVELTTRILEWCKTGSVFPSWLRPWESSKDL